MHRHCRTYDTAHEVLVGAHLAIASEYALLDAAALEFSHYTAKYVPDIGKVAFKGAALDQHVSTLGYAHEASGPVIVDIDSVFLGHTAAFYGRILGIAYQAAGELSIERCISVESTILKRRVIHPAHQAARIAGVGIGANGYILYVLTHLSCNGTILYGAGFCIANQSSAIYILCVNRSICQV